MIGLDLTIAYVITGFVILLFLVSRMRGLPGKSKRNILFILGAVASMVGVSLFREYRVKSLRKELKAREDILKQKEKNLITLKGKTEVSEQELRQLRAKLEEQRAAYEKHILNIKAKNKAEKERIDKLTGEDLHNEFLATFGND